MLSSSGSLALSRNSTVVKQRSVPDVLKIVDHVFVRTVDEMACVACSVGCFHNGSILPVQSCPTGRDGSPEIVQDMPMKSDALSGSQPNFPDPHSICSRQQPSADVTVELVSL